MGIELGMGRLKVNEEEQDPYIALGISILSLAGFLIVLIIHLAILKFKNKKSLARVH